MKVWDAETGQELLSLKGHTSQVTSVAYGPDGRRVLSGSWDKTVRVWGAETGQELLSLKGHTAAVNCAAFGPDGRHVATGSDDKTVRVWDTQKGEAVTVFKWHEDTVRTLAFDPGGRFVVLEYAKESSIAPASPLHKMSFEEIRREIEPLGFAVDQLLDFLPVQHGVIFTIK